MHDIPIQGVGEGSNGRGEGGGSKDLAELWPNTTRSHGPKMKSKKNTGVNLQGKEDDRKKEEMTEKQTQKPPLSKLPPRLNRIIHTYIYIYM